jgi:hypothetical protein
MSQCVTFVLTQDVDQYWKRSSKHDSVSSLFVRSYVFRSVNYSLHSNPAAQSTKKIEPWSQFQSNYEWVCLNNSLPFLSTFLILSLYSVYIQPFETCNSSIHSSTHTPIHPSIFLSVCLSVRPSVHPSIYLRLYSPCGPWPLFQFVNLYTVGRTPWMGNQPVASLCLHAEQHKHRINAHRHPCLEWDSNPRSQCSSGRSRCMP